MTRSSTNELYTPYKDPEREFRSSKKHFKSLSLDELRSPDFNLLSDKEYSEEEEEEAMAETMEQYMSKTRTDYGSGVARPKIDNKDQFELKGQFLKELRENTFSGSDNEDANEHIEKVLEIVDLFHVPNITVDQLMLRVFPISLTGAASRWLRNEPTGSIKTWEDLKTNWYDLILDVVAVAVAVAVVKVEGVEEKVLSDSNSVLSDSNLVLGFEFNVLGANNRGCKRANDETARVKPSPLRSDGCQQSESVTHRKKLTAHQLLIPAQRLSATYTISEREPARTI
ncbi:hypothetical protein Tco_0828567 [Tanacetum coccineum]